MSSPTTSAAVERILREEGVEVWTDVAIEGVTEREVQTSRGAIPARTLAGRHHRRPVVRDSRSSTRAMERCSSTRRCACPGETRFSSSAIALGPSMA